MPLLPTDYSPWHDTSSEDMTQIKDNSTAVNEPNILNETEEVKPKAMDTSNSSMSEFEGLTESDLPQGTKYEICSNISTHLSSEYHDNSGDDTSESDSLINPRLLTKPKNLKRRTKRVNNQDMCDNSQSESDDTSFTEVKSRPAKPIPGMVSSHSRVTAQNLFVKCRASKGLDTQYPEYSTNSDPNRTEQNNYDGDTEAYEISGMKSGQGKSAVTSPVKSEPVPNDDSSKVLTPSKRITVVRTGLV